MEIGILKERLEAEKFISGISIFGKYETYK